MSCSEVDCSEVAEGNNRPQPLGCLEIADTLEPEVGKFREWVFTLNNYTPEEEEKVKLLKCRYLVYGREVGPECGTPHLQGYFVLDTQRSWSALRKEFPRMWLRVRAKKSNPKACRQYIIGPYSNGEKVKDYNPEHFEKGTIPEQGKRNDLKEFHDAIKSGKRGRDLSVDHLEVRAKYPKLETTLIQEEDEAKAIQMFRDGFCPEVHVRWGEPGTGKSRYVYDKHDAESIYELNLGDGCKQSVWWDGYRGQEVILINDFDGELGWKYLLRLLDRYPFRMQIKGSHCWRLCKYIYITANEPPERWYSQHQAGPLMRRLTSVTEVI